METDDEPGTGDKRHMPLEEDEQAKRSRGEKSKKKDKKARRAGQRAGDRGFESRNPAG